jgi:hypothetical protein
MGDQAPQSFIGDNLLLIGIIFLAIFIYLVLLIRKRWKDNFLHKNPKDDA